MTGKTITNGGSMDAKTQHADDCLYGQTFAIGGVLCGRPCTCGVGPVATNTVVGYGAIAPTSESVVSIGSAARSSMTNMIIIGPGLLGEQCDCVGAATHCMTIGRPGATITVHRDGSVEADSIETASDAGAAFVEFLRDRFAR